MKQRAASGQRSALLLARACQLDRAAAVVLVTRLGPVPRAFSQSEAQALVAALRDAQLDAELTEGPPTAAQRCVAHPSLESSRYCERCREPTCVVCVEVAGRPWCAQCLARERRRLFFRNVRVAALLVVMAGVALWGFARQRRLDRRLKWNRPLAVSVVLVSQTPVAPADVAKWRAATGALTAWFTREWHRHHPESEVAMVNWSLAPVATVEALPPAPQSLEETVAFGRALDGVDEQVGPLAADGTVYVVLSGEGAAARRVEGIGEAGGRRGLVYAGLGADDLTLETVAVAHEFLHCLGATDKYDEAGHARRNGLVEPDRQPRYPQPAGDVMVGERPLGPNAGAPLTSLDEARVGPVTAQEIRWLPAGSDTR